jgi:hypothetical protein
LPPPPPQPDCSSSLLLILPKATFFKENGRDDTFMSYLFF